MFPHFSLTEVVCPQNQFWGWKYKKSNQTIGYLNFKDIILPNVQKRSIISTTNGRMISKVYWKCLLIGVILGWFGFDVQVFGSHQCDAGLLVHYLARVTTQWTTLLHTNYQWKMGKVNIHLVFPSPSNYWMLQN